MTHRMTTTFLALVFYWTQVPHVTPSQTTQQPQVLSVCELFSNIQAYRGKMISVRGVYYFGLRDSGCSNHLETQGWVWPTALWVTDSSDRSGVDEQPVEFSTDSASRRELDETEARLLKEIKAKRKRLVVTITGLLRTREKYVRVDTHYGRIGNGYGHLNAFPAELVIKRVDKIVVEDADSSSKSKADVRRERK